MSVPLNRTHQLNMICSRVAHSILLLSILSHNGKQLIAGLVICNARGDPLRLLCG